MSHPTNPSPSGLPPAPILALDTSTMTARVAVLDLAGEVRVVREATAARHSSNLLRLCDEALRVTGVSIADLGAIACGAGPGSFTGLRVGMAVAKGLALPLDLRLVLVSSLEALARDLAETDARDDEVLLPCIDAGKDQVFAAAFRRQPDGATAHAFVRLGEWAALPGDLPSAIAESVATRDPLVFGGNGAHRYREVLASGLGPRARHVPVEGPTAVSIGRAAVERLRRGETDDLVSAVPSYGRAPDITRPKPR